MKRADFCNILFYFIFFQETKEVEKIEVREDSDFVPKTNEHLHRSDDQKLHDNAQQQV